MTLLVMVSVQEKIKVYIYMGNFNTRKTLDMMKF